MKYDDKTLEIGCWLSVCSTYSSLTKFAEEEALKKQLEVSNPKEARLNLLIYFMFLTEWFVNQFIKPKERNNLLDVYHVYITRTLTEDLKLPKESMDQFQENCNLRLKKYGNLRKELAEAPDEQKGIKFGKYLIEIYKDINNSDQYDKAIMTNFPKIIPIEQNYLKTLEKNAKEKRYI